jgi:DNA processing protein
MEGDRLYREIHFSLIPGLGPIQSRRILEGMGGLNRVFSASSRDFMEMEGMNPKGADHIFKSLRDPKIQGKAEQEMIFIERNQVQTYFIENDNYPIRLKQCPDAPVILYFQGLADLNHSRIVSLVGSRKATPYGKKLTQDFIEYLREFEVLTVSGLAYGIDIQAHRSSLDYHIPTLGVLGHGLDQLYPSAHRETSARMKNGGGLISEFCSGTPIIPGLFPRRNRIIAGLCDALVVVEASEKGGALISADLASSYDREVFAFPGRVNDPYSVGCLGLIRDQKAQLICNARDFTQFMNWESSLKTKPENHEFPLGTSNNPMNSEEIRVWEYFNIHSKTSLSQLGFAFPDLDQDLNEILLNLEIQGRIRSLPGKIFEKV